jgi:large subunit ribosomal protein L10
MIRQQKDTLVSGVKKDLEKAAGALFLDFTGLTVAEADALRRKTREAKITYKVVKNTLLARAMKGTSYESAATVLKGTPTGVIIGGEDPVAAAKMTFEFLKTTEHLKIKGGIVDKKAINAKEAEALSKMPGRVELLAGIVALTQAPGRKVAGAVLSPGRRIAGAIKALVEKLEKAG